MTQQDVKVKLTPGVRRDSAVFIVYNHNYDVINSRIHVYIRSTQVSGLDHPIAYMHGNREGGRERGSEGREGEREGGSE